MNVLRFIFIVVLKKLVPFVLISLFMFYEVETVNTGVISTFEPFSTTSLI